MDGGFGGWSEGAHFGMGDGAIRFVSSNIDRSVVEQLAGALRMPDPTQTNIPNRTFECGGAEFSRTTLRFENEEARVIDYEAVLDATTAEQISRCKNVEALKIGSLEDTEEVIRVLQSLPRLKFLSGIFNSDLLDQLKVALPGCEIYSTGR